MCGKYGLLMTIEELRDEARRLPAKERGSLAADLLESLGPADYDVSDEEVLRRVAESESGEAADISFEELRDGLQNLPGK